MIGKGMRLAVMMVCLSVTSLFASVSAQNVKLDLQVEDKWLVEVMDLLQEKSGYSFVYSAADVEGIGGLTFDLRGMTVTEALDAVLEGTGLTYTIEENLIILKKAPVQVAQTTKRIVKGVVLGTAPKDTLAGVNVMVKGTQAGVTTDMHGAFSIMIPDGEVTLVF